jgi:hypothetical protein
MFRVVLPPIIRSAYNCVYSFWYLSHCYCYLPLSWKSWNWFECAVGGVRHATPEAVDTVECAPDDGWKYHPKHVEQFLDINKVSNVESFWIYIGILLGAHCILHISRIRVKHSLLILRVINIFLFFSHLLYPSVTISAFLMMQVSGFTEHKFRFMSLYRPRLSSVP